MDIGTSFLIEHRIEGGNRGGRNSNHDTIAVASVKRENAEQTSNRDERVQNLKAWDLVMEDHRLENGGKKGTAIVL